MEGGVVVLEGGARLPEGAPVAVEILPPERDGDRGNPMLEILDLAVDTGIPDLSRNIDHYLYGHPRVGDAGE